MSRPFGRVRVTRVQRWRVTLGALLAAEPPLVNKIGLTSALALALLTGPAAALAQSNATMAPPPADAATNPIPAPQSPAAAAPTGPASTTPQVTVTAKPLHACKPGDQACIDQVSEAIWTRYPKQIEAMCVADGWQRINQGFAMQDLGIGTNTVADHPPPATQALCEYGAKMKKR